MLRAFGHRCDVLGVVSLRVAVPTPEVKRFSSVFPRGVGTATRRLGVVGLRRLEIVFIFPRLVLEILFQIQFGLSYQCEIYHRHKMKRHKISTSYFFQTTCYHSNQIMHSVAPPKSKAIVLIRKQVGEVF